VTGRTLAPAPTRSCGPCCSPWRPAQTLAALFKAERRLNVDLTFVPCQGLERWTWFDDTGLPWVMASPNMPALDTATVFPGTVLIEGTNLSEGRGTTRPFEIFGAPYLDAEDFAARLNSFDLSGACFRPVWFRPTFDKWAGELCGGAQLHVTDRTAFRPCLAGVAVLHAAIELGGESFAWRQPPFEYVDDKAPIDILSGSARLRQQLDAGVHPAVIAQSWQPQLDTFSDSRQAFLHY
jgi:uncharacterized protein YbbC (DUF1343 family)